MIKGKEWLQEELSKLTVYKSFNLTKFENREYPIDAKYNAAEVDALVAQLGEPIEEIEQQEIL